MFPWKRGWKNVETVVWAAEVPGYLYQVRSIRRAGSPGATERCHAIAWPAPTEDKPHPGFCWQGDWGTDEEAKRQAEEHYAEVHPLGALALATKKNPKPAEGLNPEMAERLIRKEHEGRWGRAVRMEKLLGPHRTPDGHHAHDGMGAFYWEALSCSNAEGEQDYHITTWRLNEWNKRAYFHGKRRVPGLEAMALLMKDLTKKNPKPAQGPDAEAVERLLKDEYERRWGNDIRFKRLLGPHMTQDGHHAHDGTGAYYWRVLDYGERRLGGQTAVVWCVTTWREDKTHGRALLHSSRVLDDIEVIAMAAKDNPLVPKIVVAQHLREFLEWLEETKDWEAVSVSPIEFVIGRGKGRHDPGRGARWEATVVLRNKKMGVAHRAYLMSRASGPDQGFWFIHYRVDLAPVEEVAVLTKDNPRSLDVYDPREEQLRAQRQAIYESQVLRALGRKGPFRSRSGKRADSELDPGKRAELVRRAMFAMGTSVQRRDARLYPGTQQFTPKSARESARRYEDVDKLVRNRQDYEETLGLARKSGFYRVTKEPTRSGLAYFVWPMPPGMAEPVGAESEQVARQIAGYLNRTADPRKTGIWWKPPSRQYSRVALRDWLPPGEVFSPVYNFEQARPRRRRRA